MVHDGMTEEKFYTVSIKAFAFDTEEEANKYMEAVIDKLCEMPESEEVGFTYFVKLEDTSV